MSCYYTSMTYARFCAQNTKFRNLIAPFHNSRIFFRQRSDKPVEDVQFSETGFEEHDKEEETLKIRNVSNMPEWQYNKYKGRMNDLNEGYNDYVMSRKFLRKMYAKYGGETGVNPSIMWPSKPELEEMMKDELEWEASFQQLLKTAQQKRKAEQEEHDKRQKLVESQMAKMSTMIKDYKKRQEKMPSETAKMSEKRAQLVEEATEYFGYRIEPRGEKFKEYMAMKIEADKTKKKEEQRAQRKKNKEESAKIIMQKAGKKEKDKKQVKPKDDDDAD